MNVVPTIELPYPRYALDRALLDPNRPLPQLANAYAQQVHWNEQRKITKTGFYEDHILFVAASFAHIFPHCDEGIAAALLHDTIENAPKLIDRIADELKNAQDKQTEFDVATLPELFLQFFERDVVGGHFARMDNLEKLGCLKEKFARPEERVDLKKKFRNFMILKIKTDLGSDVYNIVLILTRQTPAQFMHMMRNRAKDEIDTFNMAHRNYKTHKNYQHFMKQCFYTPLSRFLQQAHGLTREMPEQEAEPIFAHVNRNHCFLEKLSEFLARDMLAHPNVLGDTEAVRTMPFKNLFIPENIDKIHATGFSDNRDPEIAKLLPIACSIKCLDNIHNITTLGYSTPEQHAQALKVFHRIAFELPNLEKGGANAVLLHFDRTALRRVEYKLNLNDVTEKPKQLPEPPNHDWLARQINRGIGTRLEAA